MRTRLLATAFLVLAYSPLLASSQEIDCLACHAKLKSEKVVHTALEMGCSSCHTGIDASVVPHKKTTANGKGLSAEQPDLCYGCHDKAMFTRKNVHAALSMGCTSCHNPHSSARAKLLLSEAPELCFSCHDKAEFSKKVVHAPVAAGMCLTCHVPHSSDNMALLAKKPYALCLDCHADVTKSPHAVSGISSGKHPLGEPKMTDDGREKKVKDPSRKGKPFYCGSCHDPHSSGGGRLFRFNANTAMSLCTNCHKM